MDWTVASERRVTELIERVVDDRRAAPERAKAWKELLIALSPEIERIASRHHLLRRCGLTGEDEPRAILVAVISRLADRDHDNLRRFHARLPIVAPPEVSLDTLDHLERLGEPEEATDSPLRAWLHTLVGFATKDHVRHRLGWRSVARTGFHIEPAKRDDAAAVEAAIAKLPGVHSVAYDAAAATMFVEHVPGAVAKGPIQKAIEGAGWKVLAVVVARDRRHVGSGADRLDDAPEPSTRPGMTDRLTLEQMLGEIRAFADGFPPDLRTALDLWMSDVDYPDIAQRVGVPGPAEARALVRSAQARLRAKFRGAWPEWFGA